MMIELGSIPRASRKSVLRALATRVIVMYAGQIQEQGRVDDVLANPQHPYTKALIQAVPDPDSTDQRLHQIEGQPPDLLNLPDGCSFADRCAFVVPRCRSERPELYTSAAGSDVRCHLFAPEASAQQ